MGTRRMLVNQSEVMRTNRNRCIVVTLLCALGVWPVAHAQQSGRQADLETFYAELRGQKMARVDSVFYTGSDFDQVPGGFAWQRGEGKGWTKGCRITLDRVKGAWERKARALFTALQDQQRVVLNEHEAGTVFDPQNVFFGYQMQADGTFCFIRAWSEGEMCVPRRWPTLDRVDATLKRKPTFMDALDEAQLRTLALSRLWAEVKRNFVYMDRVQVNWDSLYAATLPEVQAASNRAAVTRILQRIVAQLHDGHTYVWGDMSTALVPIDARWMDGHLYVDGVRSRLLREAGVRRGMELTAINGQGTAYYAQQYVMPYIASSTPQWTEHVAYEDGQVFCFQPGYTVRLTLTDGSQNLEVNYVAGCADEVEGRQRQRGMTLLPLDHGMKLLRIGSFADSSMREAFDQMMPDILEAKALVIDLRGNGGGNSGNSEYILRHLTAASVKSCAWESPVYVPAYRSWGRRMEWHKEEGEVMPPLTEHGAYLGPVALLVDAGTFSAAEDFAAMFLAMRRGAIVGMPTGGSTGNGVRVELLPGVWSANICAKHDVAPDGTEYVGIGIQPTLRVTDTYDSYFVQGRDNALQAAQQWLQGQLRD